MFLRYLYRKIKNISIAQPFLYFGKRYIYNTYRTRGLSHKRFPSEVWIENTNCCNAKCIMCPRESMTREVGFMEFSLYEKLIKEISKHKEDVKKIHLHNYGEPLMDKILPERIKLAKDHGIKHTYFVTNASLLTVRKSREIMESGLDEFKISFCGTDMESYKETMKGLAFEQTLDNIRNFFRIRKEAMSQKPKVVIQYIPMNENKTEIDDFFKLMKPFIDEGKGDRLNIFRLHNYGDGKAYIKPAKIITTCSYPWRTMVILYDGRVVVCCLDYNGIQVIGDVNKNTIEEIWNNERYNTFRKDFKKLRYYKYPICRKCDIPQQL